MQTTTTLPDYVNNHQLFGRRGYEALDWLCRSLWGDKVVPSGRVLEIGAGEGLMSLWILHAGARAVTSLEPEADGATDGVAARAARHREALGIPRDTWDYRPDTLQSFTDEPGSYRLILSYASVNHLDEDACVKLLEDPAARRRYVELFRKVHDLLEPGGMLILSDVARENYWARLGRPSPWAPEIEWHKHQEPWTWSAVMRDAGLITEEWEWHHPFYRTRHLAPLLNNRVAARLLASGFVIRARRPASAASANGGPR